MKQTSKFLSVLLALAMVAGLLPWATLNARADSEVVASGSCGAEDNEGGKDSVTWTLTKSGVLTISGVGAIMDCTSKFYQPWGNRGELRNQITAVIVNNGVTRIGATAFSECTALTSVTLPNSVKTIGDTAFYKCSALASITIPDSVTSIEGYAFGYTPLTSVVIPDSVTNIGGYVFRQCTNLTCVVFGNGLTESGYASDALAETNALGTVYVHAGINENVRQTISKKKTVTECHAVKVVTDGNGTLTVSGGDVPGCGAFFTRGGTATLAVSETKMGYVLKALTYSDGGEPVDVPESKSFAMPADKDVTVHATFEFDANAAAYALTLPDFMEIVSATNESVDGKYVTGTRITFRVKPGSTFTGEVYDGAKLLTPDAGGVYTVTVGDADVVVSAKKSIAGNGITVSVAEQTYTYTGEAFEPAVTVTVGETDITDQCDVAYANNTNAGTASATVTAKDSGTAYCGSVTVDFTILRKSVSVPESKTLKFTGYEQTGVAACDAYTVTGGTAAAVGKYTATVTPTNNYRWEDGATEAKSIPWEIIPTDAPVARVGDTDYPSLQAAFDAAALTEAELQTIMFDDQPASVLAARTVYLVEDITLERVAGIMENKTVLFDLNGHTLTAAEGYAAISCLRGGRLCLNANPDYLAYGSQYAPGSGRGGTIVGAVGVGEGTASGADVTGIFEMFDGTITGARGASGGGVVVDKGGSFSMWGGTITSCTADQGAGVFVSANSQFEMHGGTIAGNTADDRGGGVSVANGGTFTMCGGTISGNTAKDSGGVYVGSNGTFTMEGGTISGNTAAYNGGVFIAFAGSFLISGGVRIVGNVAGGTITDGVLSGGTASNVNLGNSEDGAAKIVISDVLTDTASIGVSAIKSSAFTDGWSLMQGADPSDYFVSDDAGCGVARNEKGEAVLGTAFTVAVTGGRANKAKAVAGATVTVTAAAPATGKVFTGWTGSDGVTFADASKETTTFTMPTQDVTVTATYHDYSLANGTVYAPAGAALLVASYDKDGKMTALHSAAAPEGGWKGVTVWSIAEDAGITLPDAYKLMLVDGATFVPLCAAWGNARE